MPYYNVLFANAPSLVELQNQLRRELPAGSTFTDPATFHITLLYVEDAVDADLNDAFVAADLPVFGIGGEWVSTMPPRNMGRDDGMQAQVPVVLRVKASPQLVYLQSALFYRLQARGAKISKYHYPASYRPHITLAYVPAAPDRDLWLDADIHLEVNRYALTEEGDFTPVAEWGLLETVQVREMSNLTLTDSEQIINGKRKLTLTCVSEMRGKYPDIRLPDDVNTESIRSRGFKFVTLPVGQINSQSRNGRSYREAAMRRFAEQINQKRPEGNWGHIPETMLSTHYSNPPIRWLASQIDDQGVVWAKGLPLTKESQDYFELARDTNARVGTSLAAYAQMDGDDVLDLELITLDLADPARVGVPMTASVPVLSTEMGDPDRQAVVPVAESAIEGEQRAEHVSLLSEQKEGNLMGDKPELTAEMARELQDQIDAQRRRIRELEEAGADLQSICELFNVEKGSDPVRAMRRVKEQLEDMQRESSELLEESMVAAVANAVKLEGARDIVLEMVKAHKPVTRKALTRALDDVLDKSAIKALLKQQLAEEMGPPQGRPASKQAQSAEEPGSAWFDEDEEA
jgi:2'-5' RNA ligase